MKKFITILIAITTVSIFNCKEPNPGTIPGDDPNTLIYSKEFLGEWIRMDTGDIWYISGNSIKINETTTLSKTVKLTKTSEQVVTVQDGTASYSLFASRIANASFKAKVVFIDNIDAPNASYTGRSLIGNTGQRPPIIITNPNQPEAEAVIVQPDQDTGEITVTGQIPGDRLVITPDDPNMDFIKVEVPENWTDGQDIGKIPLAEGANLKPVIRMANTTVNINELYADGATYNFVIDIENIGTENCTGASYELIINAADFTLVSGATAGTLDTIVPGAKKQINLSLIPKEITAVSEFKSIQINITSYDTVAKKTKIWEDSVSLRIYRTPVTFVFRSQKSVQGMVRTPENATYYFKTTGTANNYSYQKDLPWSNGDYIIGFMGATVAANSETKYSFGVNEVPSTNWESFTNLHQYEPANDGESTAPTLDFTSNRSFMSYLFDGDTDYYKINLGTVPPIPMGAFTVSFNADGGTPAPADRYIQNGSKIIEPEIMTKNNFVFAGWYKDADFNNLWNFNTDTVNGDITLYARWDAPIYDIELLNIVNGGILFDNDFQGYTDAPTVSVTVRNTGNVPTGNLSVSLSGGSGFTLSNSTIPSIPVNGSDIITVSANEGLSIGTYESTVSVSNSNGINESFTVKITILNVDTVLTVTSTEEWNTALATVRSAGSGTVLVPKVIAINVSDNVAVSGITAAITSSTGFGTGTNIIVVLRGNGTLYLNSQGSIARIGSNQTLIINSGNLILQGYNSNNNAVVYVQENGKLELKNGIIRDNRNSSLNGGGGIINFGTFNMIGGLITGNTSINNSGGSDNTYNRGGGGVLSIGTFNMSGGEINGNTANRSGGGVCIIRDNNNLNSFVKAGGGIIYGNNEGIKSNTSTSTIHTGHAVILLMASGANLGTRNTTLGENDDISTGVTSSPPWNR